MASSAFIQIGRTWAMEREMTHMTKPAPKLSRKPPKLDSFILFSSPAPKPELIMAVTATPKAEKREPISQFTVAVRFTADVASAPSRPTMAVSTYCRRVERISSAIIGRARVMMALKVSLERLFISRLPYSIH